MKTPPRPPKILVSACLLGQPVRYNGKALTLENEKLAEWRAEGLIVPFCPEISAGFPTPRPAAEIEPGHDGRDVLAGNAKVLEQSGSEVTDAFVKGAQLALAKARSAGCRFALLADGSPSCGSSFIFSGRFDGQRHPGTGVVSTLLREHGIQVFAQHQVLDLEQALLNS